MTCNRCDRCGEDRETYIGAERGDGSRYEKTDGTIAGPHDVHLCVDCLTDWLDEANETDHPRA